MLAWVLSFFFVILTFLSIFLLYNTRLLIADYTTRQQPVQGCALRPIFDHIVDFENCTLVVARFYNCASLYSNQGVSLGAQNFFVANNAPMVSYYDSTQEMWSSGYIPQGFGGSAYIYDGTGSGSFYLSNYDQYAAYLLYAPSNKATSRVRLSGYFPSCAHFSFALTSGSGASKYISGKDLTTVDGLNPYIVGNRTYLAASTLSAVSESQISLSSSRKSNVLAINRLPYSVDLPPTPLASTTLKARRSPLFLYTSSDPKDTQVEGYYMGAFVKGVRYAAMGVRIPTVNDPRSGVCLSCNVEYFSVSSIQQNKEERVPFFTCPAYKMRTMFHSSEGIGYNILVYAPFEEVTSWHSDQKKEPGDPPLYIPPNAAIADDMYDAYVLPSKCLLFRYKEPDTSWEGSPSNIDISSSTSEYTNVPFSSLGTWQPVVYCGNDLDECISALKEQLS